MYCCSVITYFLLLTEGVADVAIAALTSSNFWDRCAGIWSLQAGDCCAVAHHFLLTDDWSWSFVSDRILALAHTSLLCGNIWYGATRWRREGAGVVEEVAHLPLLTNLMSSLTVALVTPCNTRHSQAGVRPGNTLGSCSSNLIIAGVVFLLK